MKAKKYLVTATAVATLAVASLTGCGNKSADQTPKFVDGTYSKVSPEADKGYIYELKMTVKDGKITEINWDGQDEEGNSKKQLAKDGVYVMTEDGLNWAEQSEALAKYVVDNQSIEGITTDENGKTDAVAGVSIAVTGFMEFVSDCMEQATSK